MRFCFWIQIIFLFFCCPFRLIGLSVSMWFIVSSAFNSSSNSSNQKESRLKQKETTLNIHTHTFWLLKNRYAVTSKANRTNEFYRYISNWNDDEKVLSFFFHFHRLASTRIPLLILNMKGKKKTTHWVYQRCFLMYTIWTRNGSRKQSFSSEMMNF